MTNSNEYTFWQQLLDPNQPDPEIVINEVQSGRYRKRSHKDGPFEAVGIWISKNTGKHVCRIIREKGEPYDIHNPDEIWNVFQWAVKNPISDALYKEFKETRVWPDGVNKTVKEPDGNRAEQSEIKSVQVAIGDYDGIFDGLLEDEQGRKLFAGVSVEEMAEIKAEVDEFDSEISALEKIRDAKAEENKGDFRTRWIKARLTLARERIEANQFDDFTVDSDAKATKIAAHSKALSKFKTAADKIRKEAKEFHTQINKVLERVWQDKVITPMGKVVVQLDDKLKPWLQQKAEEKRLAEEKVREEREAAEKKADEDRKEAERLELEANQANDKEKSEKLSQQASELRQTAADTEKEARKNEKAVASKPVNSGVTGGKKSLVTTYSWEVEDYKLVFEHVKNEKAVRDWITDYACKEAKNREIPGMKRVENTSVR